MEIQFFDKAEFPWDFLIHFILRLVINLNLRRKFRQ